MEIEIERIYHDQKEKVVDQLALEVPLTIHLQNKKLRSPSLLCTILRTPGNDQELIAGFLLTEGVIQCSNDLIQINSTDQYVVVTLADHLTIHQNNSSHFGVIHSGCGFCGKKEWSLPKSSLGDSPSSIFIPTSKVLNNIQSQFIENQNLFSQTGALHAAAIFNESGNLLHLHEDIGRHNALDKVIGASLLNYQLPFQNSILLLSGRVSYELIHKALIANINTIASFGAPSSFAVQMAQIYKINLIGFLKNHSYNIYHTSQGIPR